MDLVQIVNDLRQRLEYFLDVYYRTFFIDKVVFSVKTFFKDDARFQGQLYNILYDNGNVTGTATINWAMSNKQYITLSGNTTLTFVNGKESAQYILHVAGAYTPTFPGTVRWTAGTTPTATAIAGKKDIYTFVYCSKESLYDGLQSPNYSIT